MWPIKKKLTNLKKDLLGNIRVKFRLNLSGRSGEEDFFQKNIKKQDGGRITSSMTSQKTFSSDNLGVDDAQNFSDFSHAAFYLTNFHRHTSSPMTSRKITPVPHRDLSKMYQAKFFSIARFLRYRGPKFIGFFKMAPVSHDLWRHNYQLIMLSKNIHTMVKILSRSDLAFQRKWFLKRKRPQNAGGKRIIIIKKIGNNKQKKNNRVPCTHRVP